MKKIKDFENHQEKVIQEMRERFRIYKKKKKVKEKWNCSLREENSRPSMLCKICDTNETDNPGICDDCKFCMIDDKDITPNF